MTADQLQPDELVPQRIDQTTFGKYGNCYSACIAMLLGLSIDEVPTWQPGIGLPDQMGQARAWLMPRGWNIVELEASNAEARAVVSHGFYIASGQTSRGLLHAVVYRDGELWHDPHPDKSGIQSVETIDLLIPLRPWNRIESLTRARDEVIRDAARYRWIRRMRSDVACLFVEKNTWHGYGFFSTFKAGDDLDVAIDAEMLKQSGTDKP